MLIFKSNELCDNKSNSLKNVFAKINYSMRIKNAYDSFLIKE